MFKLLMFITIPFLITAADSTLVAQTNFWELAGLDSLNVEALAINSSGYIFAGVWTASSRGVYRSTDSGNNWTQTGLTNYSVRDIAINSSGQVFAGTYAGVFRSTRNGNSWIQLLGSPSARRLAINSNRHIFAATDTGIFRSTDNGDSWTPLGGSQHVSGLIAINTNGEIFAGSDGSGLYRSTDNGNNWTRLSSAPGPMSLAMNSNGHIFLGNYDSRRVHRSTDNGDSWTELSDSPNAYALAINSAGHIFAGARGGPSGSGIYRSTDDGDSWTNTGLTQIPCGPPHIAINSFGYVYVGTCIGVFRSVMSTTSVREVHRELPEEFALEQNYPNPFNPSTNVRFQIADLGLASLRIYDVLGREIATLVNEELKPGSYEVTWDASGRASGVYFYRLQTENYVDTKKLMLVR